MRITEAKEAKKVEYESDGRRRLRILARFLREEVPEERFDILEWGNDTACGFAGCALGWGSQCPQLRAEGLRWDGFQISYRGAVNAFAAESFFDLCYDQSTDFFKPDSYRSWLDRGHTTPTEVAARIEAWLEATG